MKWQTFIVDDGFMHLFDCDEKAEQECPVFVGTAAGCVEYMINVANQFDDIFNAACKKINMDIYQVEE